MSNGNHINDRISRIEEIIDQLEAGDVSLNDAKTLREEAHDEIAALREELGFDEGELVGDEL